MQRKEVIEKIKVALKSDGHTLVRKGNRYVSWEIGCMALALKGQHSGTGDPTRREYSLTTSGISRSLKS